MMYHLLDFSVEFLADVRLGLEKYIRTFRTVLRNLLIHVSKKQAMLTFSAYAKKPPASHH
jgi:hypothetical protein